MALKAVDIHCLGLCRKSLPTPGPVPGTWLMLNKYFMLRCQYLPSCIKHFTCAMLFLVLITLNVGNSCYPISQMRTEASGPYIHVSQSFSLLHPAPFPKYLLLHHCHRQPQNLRLEALGSSSTPSFPTNPRNSSSTHSHIHTFLPTLHL